MKLQIFLLIALFTIAIAEPSCDIDSMCMGCDATTSDKCTHCYNGVVATYGARALVSNACSTKLTAITGCEIYRNTIAAATAATLENGEFPCWKCESGKQGLMTPSTPAPHDDITATGKEWTSSLGGAGSCQTTPTGVTELTNCLNVQIVDTCTGTGCTSANDQVCLITDSGWGFAAGANAQAANASQATGIVATGCDNYIWSPSTTTHQCHNPTSGHAISSTGIVGVAFTVDTNCRQLSTGDLVCGVCTDAYWFGGATCYLSAKMLVLSAAAFFLAMIM